ncbi:MAG: hypothetical protein K2O40_01830 [Lachnospiraceae bacterium]|nr:hypothetical protein [Lachnospiraceae bacterium]
MWGDSKYGAQSRYDEYNTTQVKLKLNCKTDADVIRWINGHKTSRNSSVQGAIKALIRADIASQEKQP